MNIMRVLIYLVFGSGLSLVTSSANTETPGIVDPDWPCEQILVPEVPAAVIWSGPAITGLDGAWQKVDRVSMLVRRITSSRYDQNAAEQEITEFASRQESQQKDLMLTLLFAGVLEELNRDRSMMLSGIKRYSRGQAIRAERLGKNLDEIARLEDDLSPDSRARLDVLWKQMEFKQRIFDEREEFIHYLCLQPVAVEQRLGFLARSIASQLN
ncbi:MAG: hypothetical protein GY696_04375 [Gammaproteobacteria bacterium]|nr:hypothetical protein [Gammaproteobacteria bacterium]